MVFTVTLLTLPLRSYMVAQTLGPKVEFSLSHIRTNATFLPSPEVSILSNELSTFI